MGVAIYIVPEREITGFDHMVNGKAVGHARATTLTRICRELKVPSLYDFVSHDPDEIAVFWEVELGEAPDDLPDEEWFPAACGLETVRALLGYLREQPEAVKNSEEIVADLVEYETVLSRLEVEEVIESFCWHRMGQVARRQRYLYQEE